MPGKTANDWAGRYLLDFKLRKSGNYIAPASANPRSPAGCKSVAPPSAAFWPDLFLAEIGCHIPSFATL
jgi:hypothetical protein